MPVHTPKFRFNFFPPWKIPYFFLPRACPSFRDVNCLCQGGSMKMTPTYGLDELIEEDSALSMVRSGLISATARYLMYQSEPGYLLQFDSPEEMALWIEQAKRSGMKFPE